MGTAIKGGLFRERPHGSIWAAHSDKTGVVSGWEARGPQYRGLSSGERKALFRLGPVTALRLAVTEAAIDAMSLAAGSSDGTLYLSAGGGWSPAMQAALRQLAPDPTNEITPSRAGHRPRRHDAADRSSISDGANRNC
jgi:hypothetical protein